MSDISCHIGRAYCIENVLPKLLTWGTNVICQKWMGLRRMWPGVTWLSRVVNSVHVIWESFAEINHASCVCVCVCVCVCSSCCSGWRKLSSSKSGSHKKTRCVWSSLTFSLTFGHNLYVIYVQCLPNWNSLSKSQCDFWLVECNYGLVLQFHLEQAQLRSKIRIESGRGMCTLCLWHTSCKQ